MNYLSKEEANILRCALGLHHTNKRGVVMNFLHPVYVNKYQEQLERLVKDGYMFIRTEALGRYKPGDYAVTPSGITAVLDEPWR